MALFLTSTFVDSFVLPSINTRAMSPCSFSLHTVSENKSTPPAEYSVVESKPKVEYAALSPGCAVKIQVGDVSLARKAWKKRRRSGSPLLVPCSILSVDERNMVQWNVLYLLQKFGTPLNKMEASQQHQLGFLSDDVCLSMSEINRYYSRHLGTSLAVSICRNTTVYASLYGI